jgi:Zn-dependent M28 family amino/carboxypeptidase
MGLIAQRLTGGGDHVPFDAVGIPAFPLMQDPLEYQRTSHTNQDVLDRILPADIMQNAAMLASFAYHAANREQLMPRKRLPMPEEARHRWWLF